jgi:hypothetical protein
LGLNFGPTQNAPKCGIRTEDRVGVVDRVEYAVYPRLSSNQKEQVGFTIDRSTSGLCIRADGGEEPGTVLRVVVRDVDDRSTLDALMRVAWCRQVDTGRFRLGLEVITEGRRRMRVVRPIDRLREVAATA